MAERAQLDRVKAMVAELVERSAEEIADDGRLLGYGLDSVRALDLLYAFEDELGVSISEYDPELSGIRTVRQLADLVERRLGEATE